MTLRFQQGLSHLFRDFIALVVQRGANRARKKPFFEYPSGIE